MVRKGKSMDIARVEYVTRINSSDMWEIPSLQLAV